MYKVTNYCRLCLSKKVKIGFKLNNIPLGEKYFRKKEEAFNQLKFPLTIGWCSNCKNVQLMEVINSNLLWQNYTYLSSQTKAILNHFNHVSNYIVKKFKIKKNDLVIDIGSNDGSLLYFFKKKKIKVLGIDPANNVVKIANHKGIETLKGLFDHKIVQKIKKNYQKPKIITAFNVFAHSEKIREMLLDVKSIMDDDGVFVFEVQYLKDIYNKKILGTFFHEHMYHHSATSLNSFFNSFNLTLFDIKKANVQKGSIIGFVCKKNKRAVSNSIKKILRAEKLNKDTEFLKLIDFKNFINFQKKKCQKILENYKNKVVGAYGAARSGPSLAINLGLNKYLSLLFDDHQLKVGKFSPLNGLKVYPTKDILKFKPNICVVLAYLHLKKIIKKNKKYLNQGGMFLSIYPKPNLISLKNYKKFI